MRASERLGLSSASSDLAALGGAALVFLAAGVAAFLLLPGYVGSALALVCFIAVACLSPLLSLLTILAMLPLHFLLRRPFGPLDLSLPDVVLLASVVGLLLGVYWRALLSGSSAELLDPLRRAVRSPYFWPALLLVTISTVTLIILLPDTREGLRVGFRAYSLIIEPIAVYALVLIAARNRQRRWLALDVLFAGAVLVCLYGLFQALTVVITRPEVVGGNYRVVSVFNHPNTLGLYLSRTLPLFGALGLALGPRAGGFRARAYLVGAALMGVAMLLSGSRGGWLAVAVAALVIAALLRRWKWLLPAAAAGVAGVVALALTGQDRLRGLFTPGRGSADTRERLWRAAIEEIGKSPLWGTGLGNVRWMRRYIPRQRLQGTELIDAHNLFLDFGAKLGVIGLLAILGLLARFYWIALTAYRRSDGDTRALAVGLLAAMTAAVVHGMVDAFYFGLPFAVLFWFFLGMAETLDTVDE